MAVLVLPEFDIGIDAYLFQSSAAEELIPTSPAVVWAAPAKENGELVNQMIRPVRPFYYTARGNTERPRMALQILEAGPHWCSATNKVGLAA